VLPRSVFRKSLGESSFRLGKKKPELNLFGLFMGSVL